MSFTFSGKAAPIDSSFKMKVTMHAGNHLTSILEYCNVCCLQFNMLIQKYSAYFINRPALPIYCIAVAGSVPQPIAAAD